MSDHTYSIYISLHRSGLNEVVDEVELLVPANDLNTALFYCAQLAVDEYQRLCVQAQEPGNPDYLLVTVVKEGVLTDLGVDVRLISGSMDVYGELEDDRATLERYIRGEYSALEAAAQHSYSTLDEV